MRFGFVPKDEWDRQLFEKAFRDKKIECEVFDRPAQWIRFNSGIEAGYFRREQDFSKFMREEYAEAKKNTGKKDVKTSQLSGMLVRSVENAHGFRDEQTEFLFDYLSILEAEGMLVVNSPQSIRNACRKHVAYYLLSKAGLPIPKSFASNDAVRAYLELGEIGFPQVLKPCEGGGGAGVVYGGEAETSGDVTSLYGLMEKPVIVQEFVGDNTGDVRVIVVGDKVVGGIKRLTPKGLHKSNVTLGGKAEKIEVDDELGELSLKAADAVGCKIVGVDLIVGKDGYRILEVNSSPSFNGFKKATGVKVEDIIVEYLVSQTRR
ncbi:MAG: RimK family alpha-L-glutamate ligase [Candidatus Altiarchaeota archaeon]